METSLSQQQHNHASRVSLILGLISAITTPIFLAPVVFEWFFPGRFQGWPAGEPFTRLFCLSLPIHELLAITAIASGILALGQIKASGESGRGAAVAGLCLGSLGLACVILFYILAIIILRGVVPQTL